MVPSETPPQLPLQEALETKKEYPLMDEGESLDDYFTRVGEIVPHVKIELYSAAHVNYEDARGVREILPHADIYIPEGVGWKQSNIDRKNDISHGKEDTVLDAARAEGIETADFGRASEDVLSGTGVPVVFIDQPHEELAEIKKNRKFKADRNNMLPYDESVRMFAEGIERFTQDQLEREIYMRTHLGPKILEALAMKPELRTQDELTVLMPLGAAHTDIYHKLKGSGTDIHRTYQTSPYIYPHETEYQRRLAFGIDVDLEQVERSFVERLVYKGLEGVSNMHTTPEGQLFKRTITGLLDANERREYYAEYQDLHLNYLHELDAKKKQLRSEFGEHWREVYREWAAHHADKELEQKIKSALHGILQKKGIQIPSHENEMIEFLRTYAPTEIAYIEQMKKDI